MFSCQFCEIFKNTYFIEHLWTTASDFTFRVISSRNFLFPSVFFNSVSFFPITKIWLCAKKQKKNKPIMKKLVKTERTHVQTGST